MHYVNVYIYKMLTVSNSVHYVNVSLIFGSLAAQNMVNTICYNMDTSTHCFYCSYWGILCYCS